MQREPYDYSPIISRPALSLPGGARVAVWFGLNVEYYRFGSPSMSLAPFTSELVPDPLNHGWRDYGPRVGVWRLSEIFAKHGITPSAITNTEVFDHYPEIIEHGKERGWAFVGHGRSNSEWHVGMDREQERERLSEIVRRFETSVGRTPRGWLGPALTATAQTVELLAELGFDYTLDWANDDQPYAMNVEKGRLLSVPYSSEVNDIPAFVLHHQTGEQFAQSIVDQFDVLYAEGADSARVMGVGVHPFLVGQPFRAKHFAEALAHIAGHEDVWLATSDEIAEWYATTQPETA